jgi:hypothetical protein
MGDNNNYERFLLEKKLGTKLRNTTLEERRKAYMGIYGEFFSKFPTVAYDAEKNVAHTIAWQTALLTPLLNKDQVFMEIGAGHCLLSIEVAKQVKKVIAYEVADSIPHIANKPENLTVKIFDGIDFPEPENAVDIVYSNQVFEHLHPDDTTHHAKQYYKMLTDKGKVIIITPHALTGPHDVSRDFSTKPEGFHMKEYTYAELRKILLSAGFKKVKIFIGNKKSGYSAMNIAPFIVLEKMYSIVPRSLRYKMKKSVILKSFFGIKILGVK